MNLRIILGVVFCTLLLSQTYAQIPLNGKLFENGQAVNGIKSFSFEITDGNVNWFETHPSVQVTNGIYGVVLGTVQPFPDNLFVSQGYHTVLISVEGDMLESTAVYPAFEIDPSIPNELKDGVDWSDIQDIPTDLDQSNTNEFQILSLVEDTLYLSNGGFVVLPFKEDSLHVSDYFQVGAPESNQTYIASNSLGSNNQQEIVTTSWQNFKSIKGGELSSIKLELSNYLGIDFQLIIYQGVGVNPLVIYDQVYDQSIYDFTPSLGIQEFPIVNSTLELEFDIDYTFELRGLNNGSPASYIINTDSGNPYPKGISDFGTEVDVIFEVGLIQHVASTLSVSEYGIKVNGRVHDKYGPVMPVGTIIPYAGNTNIPDGFLVCDGRAVSREAYDDLFAAIDSDWGSGDGITTFHLPDLRGRSLRGVDVDNGSGFADRDPDKETRTACNAGGNIGNNVGTCQDDEFKSHNHINGTFDRLVRFTGTHTTTEIDHQPAGNEINLSSSGLLLPAGGNETRGKNASVKFLIKY